jgi:hypothetical protein
MPPVGNATTAAPVAFLLHSGAGSDLPHVVRLPGDHFISVRDQLMVSPDHTF